MAKVDLVGLSKSYGTNKVLDSIDLHMPEGSLVSLLGPSGCGKTTTLRLIAGFEKEDQGDILIDGNKINQLPAHKRNIGMVFQSYALFPHMTVAQNVAYGLEQRKMSKAEIEEKVDQVLKLVQMDEYKKRKPSKLSGGQQQRVALARALVIEPEILLLDECLSALDKKLRVAMQVELRRILEARKVTALFVTHDQEEALTLSDYIVVMNEGKIIQMGTPYEVYEKPQYRFVASFLGKANFIEKDGQTIGIRPEKISFCPVDSLNTKLVGKIMFVTYAGNISTYTLNCDGQEILVEISGVEGSDLQAGDMIGLTWDEDAGFPLKD